MHKCVCVCVCCLVHMYLLLSICSPLSHSHYASFSLSISLSRPLIYIFIHRPFAIPVPLISISFAYFYLCTSRCAVYLPCSSGRAHTFCMHCSPLSTPPLSLKICAIYSSSVAYEKQFLHSCTLWQAKEAREASAENQPKSCSLYVNCRWFPACLPGCRAVCHSLTDSGIRIYLAAYWLNISKRKMLATGGIQYTQHDSDATQRGASRSSTAATQTSETTQTTGGKQQ